MKIEKLPSGSYRIRKMYQGKTYTVLIDYKPTAKEAVLLMAEKLGEEQEKIMRMSFERAAQEYIASKENILSPSTVREYKSTLYRLSKRFIQKNVHDITQMDIQSEINRLSKDRSPKTVRNYHAFISSVLSLFRPTMKLSTTLPQKIKSRPYIPSTDDVQQIIGYAKGTPFEAAILLACYGMRRSEICALTLDDIEGDIIHITKALVLDENKQWVIKTTKTTASTRDIVVPTTLIDLIHQQGFVYNGHPNSLTDYLDRVQRHLGLPHFSFHKLRHFFVSKMSEMNIPDVDIMKYGGWESDYVMKTVYRHSLEDKNKEAQRRAAEQMRNALFS